MVNFTEIETLWQVLADYSIGKLIGTLFSCRTGKGEVTLDAKFGSDLFIPGIPSAIIEFRRPPGFHGSFYGSVLPVDLGKQKEPVSALVQTV